MRIIILIILLLTSAPVHAQSYAAGRWPDQAYGRQLPQPDWILAIPARRNADGSLSIWDREDPWTKAWRVPRVINGMRVVTLLGDAVDRRAITSAAIDDMLVNDMRVVLDKYGAKALVLAVYDGTYVAVAGYVPGWQAGWMALTAQDEPQIARENTISMIGDMFTGNGVQAAPQNRSGTQILALRENPYTMGMDFRLGLSGSEDQITQMVARIQSIPYGRVTDMYWEGNDLIVIVERSPGAPPFEMELQAYGLTP